MCNNIIVLYVFMFLKFVTVIILPIIILIKRRKNYANILLYVEIFLLVFFTTCNVFTVNKCVYNSTPSGIKRTNNENMIVENNNLHPNTASNTSRSLKPELKYKTYNNNYLYYYNQNKDYMNDVYYECSGQKVYMSSFGSSLTSVSIAISTLFDNNINPIQIFDYYKEDNANICDNKITIERVFDTIQKRYGSLSISKISSYNVESSIKSGGIVIAQVSAKESSKLTCDNGYIVIYNIGLDGKLSIADPALPSKSYVCPYSSSAYGNVISSENMDKSFTLDEINNEVITYYLVKKV